MVNLPVIAFVMKIVSKDDVPQLICYSITYNVVNYFLQVACFLSINIVWYPINHLRVNKNMCFETVRLENVILRDLAR